MILLQLNKTKIRPDPDGRIVPAFVQLSSNANL